MVWAFSTPLTSRRTPCPGLNGATDTVTAPLYTPPVGMPGLRAMVGAPSTGGGGEGCVVATKLVPLSELTDTLPPESST